MKTTVKDVMTTRVIWVKKDATFREMAAALRKHRVSAFPVIDVHGHLVGIISRADLLAVYDRPDEQIREEIQGLILHEFLEDPRQLLQPAGADSVRALFVLLYLLERHI